MGEFDGIDDELFSERLDFRASPTAGQAPASQPTALPAPTVFHVPTPRPGPTLFQAPFQTPTVFQAPFQTPTVVPAPLQTPTVFPAPLQTPTVFQAPLQEAPLEAQVAEGSGVVLPEPATVRLEERTPNYAPYWNEEREERDPILLIALAGLLVLVLISTGVVFWWFS